MEIKLEVTETNVTDWKDAIEAHTEEIKNLKSLCKQYKQRQKELEEYIAGYDTRISEAEKEGLTAPSSSEKLAAEQAAMAEEAQAATEGEDK